MPHTHFTCGPSTSRRIHASARNEARNLRVTSSAGCRLTYLRFAGEIIRGLIADCQQMQVFFPAIAGIVACSCGYSCLRFRVFLHALPAIFACDYRYFCLRFRVFLPEIAGFLPANCILLLPAKTGNFASQSRINLHEFRM